MNNNHSHGDKTARIAAGVKAAALICVVGSIVWIAEHATITPSEPAAPGMTSLLAPSEATALSADGRIDAGPPVAASTDRASADRGAALPAARPYPEPAGNAVRDENGHPPSF
jgi:hypothetical protein